MKKRCERIFGRIGGWAFEHRWLALALVLVVNILLLAQLSQLRVDMSNESFFRPDDQVLLDYNAFRDQFGKDEFIVIALQPDEVFSLDFLERLRGLHQAVEREVPYLDEVTSLLNVRNTRGQGDELIVEDFLEHWPKGAADLETLEQRARENSLYQNYMLAGDQQTTAIVIKPLACNPETVQLQVEGSCQPMSNVQNREMMAALNLVVDQYRTPELPIAVAGMPVVIDFLNLALERDMGLIVPLMLLVIMVMLGLLFRRASGIIYPLLIFILSLLSAIGLMALLRIPLTNITTILPSFILVVSISDAVHILALFYPAYQRCGSRRQAMVEAMEHSGLAVLMTTLTTAGGLLSFVAADIAPIADLGIVTPIGALLALGYTLLLLPALVAIFPVRLKPGQTRSGERCDRLFSRLAEFSCSRQLLVFGLFLLLLAVGVAGISRLGFSHCALKWFAEDSVIRQDTELIDQAMRGTVSLDVVIDTGRPDGVYDPELIHGLEAAGEQYLHYREGDLYVGKIIDLTTVLKETNRALHNNLQQFYHLPTERDLIAQELFLFQLSGSDDLEELVDQQFRTTRMTMHLPYRDSDLYKRFIGSVEQDLSSRFPDYEITITGVNALFVEILNKVMSTMLRSYAIALVLISILMVVMLAKVRMGLLSMIPNLFPIVMVLGLMGWLGIPLDFATILVGSISIGIIVDDTIHFLHNYARYYDQSKDPLWATSQSLKTVGRAMVTTTLVLMGGFLCNMFSSLTLNIHTGILIAATLFMALLTDFFLTPALLSLVYTSREKDLQVRASLEGVR
ncbi:efflux RND transporter permease subunit [Desulfogranum mediterraneum]|uniref:efflux RND transporter permease subunit n=1 Tax=Desulfogranum mediterraneum TaxID=160661 RepID=UPI0003F80309|nr:efflux RND transporter permease subunit [Desulfogranum mediterraneum]